MTFSATSKETIPIIAALPFNISLFVLKMANSLLSSKLSCVNFGVIVPNVAMAMVNANKEKFCASMTCVGTPETILAGKINSKASFLVMTSPAMAETKPTIAARPLMSCAVSLLFQMCSHREVVTSSEKRKTLVSFHSQTDDDDDDDHSRAEPDRKMNDIKVTALKKNITYEKTALPFCAAGACGTNESGLEATTSSPSSWESIDGMLTAARTCMEDTFLDDLFKEALFVFTLRVADENWVIDCMFMCLLLMCV